MQRIDDEKERQFRKLIALLNGFQKYEEIRSEFNITTHTTTVHTGGVPGGSTHINESGKIPTNSTLEARVVAIEQQNTLLKAELEAFKATQALQNQTFDELIKSIQAASAAQPMGGASSSQFHHN